MNDNSHDEPTNPAKEGPLVFHVAGCRQLYGEKGLTQEELSQLSGVSLRVLGAYEKSRRFPAALETALRLSLALQVSIEEMIDPRELARLGEEIAARRCRQDGDEPPQPIGFQVSGA